MNILQLAVCLSLPGKHSRTIHCHNFGKCDLIFNSNNSLVLSYIALSGGVVWSVLTGQNRGRNQNYYSNNGRKPIRQWSILMKQLPPNYALRYHMAISTCGGYGESDIVLRDGQNEKLRFDVQPYVRKYNQEGELFDHPENLFVPNTPQYNIAALIKTEVVNAICVELQTVIGML